MTNPTNNVNNICPTCNDRDLGFDGTCIFCFEANSCVKHKELRDPIAGCNSCLNESQVFVAQPARLQITPLPVAACVSCGTLSDCDVQAHLCANCEAEVDSIDWDNVGGSYEVPDYDLSGEDDEVRRCYTCNKPISFDTKSACCEECRKLNVLEEEQVSETDIPLEEAYQVTTCEKCNRYGVHEDSPICSECRETMKAKHMVAVRAQAAVIFESKTKDEAIDFLCAYANNNCLAMYDTWLYQYGVEIYGITRADYYNDYDAISASARDFGISDNWKPLTEKHLERLTADLERELQGIESMSKRFVKHLQDGNPQHLRNTAYYYKTAAELIEVIEGYLPPTGGRYIWEL